MNKPTLILASASIGRKHLLDKLGVPFTVIASNIDEDNILHPDPYKMLYLRAQAKAENIKNLLSERSRRHTLENNMETSRLRSKNNTKPYPLTPKRFLIIAADSMAILNGKTYGKAKNRADAKRIVKDLMGKTHDFVTATSIIELKLLKSPKILNTWDNLTITRVTLRTISPHSLSHYVSRYDFTRFAAGYALNETPWDLVTKIDGSYTNVVGLPFEVILPIFEKLHLFL